MEVIVRTRQQGKTHDLITKAKQEIENGKNVRLVVIHEGERKRISSEYKIDRNNIITFSEIKDTKRLAGLLDVILYWDNVDLFLANAIGPAHARTKAITVNGRLFNREQPHDEK